MTEFTQGVCADGAAILKDGVMLTIEEIIDLLRRGDALMGRGEPVGYVFRRSICSDHDPADCEEYDDFVSRADVDLEELAEYEKHGMVMEVYAKAPAVDGADRLPAEPDGGAV